MHPVAASAGERVSMDEAPSLGTVLTSALFESLTDPMLLCDSGLVVVAANRAAAELLEMPAAALSGKNADELLPSRVPVQPLDKSTVSARLAWRCEFPAPRSGRLVLEVGAGLLPDHGSGPQGWVLTLAKTGDAQAPPDFIGRSPVVQELLEFVSRIAASRASSILLVGESGTGKELIAQRLHALSPRAGAPLIPINCATLPDPLLESELFGYEKGAFTDARETKEGLLEIANGGTVFLDEIGELSLPLQVKLLRVLEDHTFRRVGGPRNISVDLRIVGATNADLEKSLAERRFRSDLYYRLNGVQIRLPTLRERPEDVQDLAIHFLRHFNRVHHRHIRGIHPAAQGMLDRYPWPGNVRELRNIMERAVLVEASPLITIGSLAITPRAGGPDNRPAPPRRAAAPTLFSLRSSEQELIAAALAETRGNQTRAAGLLGIGRFSLRYRMRKLGML